MGSMIAEVMRSEPMWGLELASGEAFDLIIDFSSPEGARESLGWAMAAGTPYYTGVTGLSAEFMRQLKNQTQIPVFYAANASIGSFLFGKLLQEAARLYQGYETSLREIHHVHKKDAPSGTAKALAELVGVPVERIVSVREGEVPGTHEMTLAGPWEAVTLRHEVKDRRLFAASVVQEAAWLMKQAPGFYGMAEFIKQGRGRA
jgi:4-hydroxy-tetrahydrodipicolinate reductase